MRGIYKHYKCFLCEWFYYICCFTKTKKNIKIDESLNCENVCVEDLTKSFDINFKISNQTEKNVPVELDLSERISAISDISL